MTLPRVAILSASLVAFFVLVGLGAIGVFGERTLTECQMRDMHQTALDFTFLPPGYDCVYLNDRGQEVGRARAPGW